MTIKASAAVAVLGAAVAATAGITYLTTRSASSKSVQCPAVNAASPVPSKPDLPKGVSVPLNQGKTY